MLFQIPALMLSVVLGLSTMAAALGTTCSAPLGAGTAAAGDPFWLETIQHQGTAAYNPNPASYPVFRNVRNYGAVGDGVHDDTVAINAAISAGSRCGIGCQSSTITPALVYFPRGTYLVSAPIIGLYYTQLVGDAKNPPTLLASAGFQGMAVVDIDPYIPNGGGAQYYANQNNFFRSVRNFVVDLRRMPASASATGFHWQAAQATSLLNVVVQMSQAAGNNHQGMFMENGSGGYMGDLKFVGGKFGIWVGNQQFTVRNVVFENNWAAAVYSIWSWGWTFQGITATNCGAVFDILTGGGQTAQTVGSLVIVDVTATNTPILVRTSAASNGVLSGSLYLSNIKLNNVPTAVGVLNGPVVLNGGTTTIASWAQGNVYHGSNPSSSFTQATTTAFNRPSSLVDGSGKIFGRVQPQYENYAASQIVSVKSQGAHGDGVTDDTAALQSIFNRYSGCKIIFFDAGTYIVTSTITIPAGTQMVGEAWSVIAGKGAAFQDVNNPQVVVRAGAPGSTGVLEISDMLFATVGPTPGAIVVEWNVHQSQQGNAGMWHTHIRLGGAAGTNLEAGNCRSGTNSPACMAAFMALHLTAQSTAYLEGTWAWLADHDLDGDGSTQLTLFSGRGILSESAGPVWMIGTGSEHHVMYQYSLQNAANHYMGLIQTESPYFQPAPAAPSPFIINPAFKDPSFPSSQTSAWALTIRGSRDVVVAGAGLYSFFSNYQQACIDTRSCQSGIVDVDSTSTVKIYGLSTVAATNQISVGGQGIINQSQNLNGFASTVTVWSST